MPSSDTGRVLAAIGHHIAAVRRFVNGMDYVTFEADERTFFAVTRCLEIISEASRCLPDDLKQRHPHLPWPQIAGAGNVYRHDYQDVLARFVWQTVQQHLDGLDQAVQEELGLLKR